MFKQNIKTLLLLTLSLSSCAVTYTDDTGNKRVIGLVNMTIDKSAGDKLKAADRVQITNIGIMYSNSPIHTGISIGYNSETTMVLKNDVATIIKDGD